MSPHLSSERISAWIAGEHRGEEALHLEECAECAAEVARFESAITVFRDSVREWSDSEQGPPAVHVPVRKWFSARPLGWVAAVAALILVVTVLTYRGMRRPPVPNDPTRADALLLEQVDLELSRTVPSTMEPLLGLMASNSTPSGGATQVGGKDKYDATQKD